MERVCVISRRMTFGLTASGDIIFQRKLLSLISNKVELTILTGNKRAELVLNSTLQRYRNTVESIKDYIVVPSSENIYLRVMAIYKKLKKLLKSDRYDIIHIMDIPVRFIPLFNNLAKNNKAELFYQKSTIIDRKKIIIYARILYKYSDKIILSSLYNYNIFKQLLKGQHNYDNDKLYLIPPPIDLELFKVPNQHSLSHQYRKSILYIGPLDFQRFPLELVFKAMNKLCDYDIKLTISIAPRFSDDFYRIKKIKTIIHSMGLTKRVHIIYKWLTPEEIAALYTRNMIAIFPFTSKIKNIVDPPLSLLEAMASGCIPIATKTLSIPLIVKDGYNGKLLDCLEPSQLAIKIKAVLESDIKKVQSNARKTIEKYFSPSRVRKLLIMLYKDRDS